MMTKKKKLTIIITAIVLALLIAAGSAFAVWWFTDDSPARRKKKKVVIIKQYPSSDTESDDNGNSDDDDDEQDVDNCHLLPPAIDKYLKEALKFLRWGALALMIILGVMDFVKAAMSDDQDALKKAWQKFAKRLIAVIILFLLPILIELILQIARLSGFVECYPSTNY